MLFARRGATAGAGIYIQPIFAAALRKGQFCPDYFSELGTELHQVRRACRPMIDAMYICSGFRCVAPFGNQSPFKVKIEPVFQEEGQFCPI